MADVGWKILAPFYPWMRNNPVSSSFLKPERAAANSLLSLISETHLEAVADLGSGSGHSLGLLHERAGIRIAVDTCAEMIAFCRPRFQNIIYLQADGCYLPLKADSLDLVLCIGLLEYIADARALFTELFRILKTGGWLMFTNSPPGRLNSLRRLYSPRLYLRHPGEIEKLISSKTFNLINKSKTRLQMQYLLQKK